MQPRSKNSFSSRFGFPLLAIAFTLPLVSVAAEQSASFRTPARQYAGAISVKLQLRKGFTEYDVPVWIKPDQSESTLDPVLMRDFGFNEKLLAFDTVRLSGQSIGKKQFKPMKSEWAIVPDYAKSCCHGVIGRDILQDFEIRVVPGTPAHIVWKRVEGGSSQESFKPEFLGELKKLFTLSQELDRPFVLNLKDRTLSFEGSVVKHASAIFSFFILPPDRDIQVTAFSSAVEAVAGKVGFQAGTVITAINGQDVGKMDRWLVEKYLRGEKTSTVTITTRGKKEFTYDFQNRRFELKK